jgi:tripartite-type tricarboxylate transporter receptor subunit TctC
MRHCKLVCVAAAFAALASGVRAQDWPSRPMTMVVPFAAGGPMDTLARILQPTLGETLGQPIIIENVPGGGGMTGSLRVSQAPVDSHMFVLASIGTHAIGYSMHSKPQYHPASDFQPVSFVADAPLMLMVKKDLAPNDLNEFIAHAKTNHAKMTFSSGGTGTSSHVSCVMLNQLMGVDVTHVPYRGGGPAFADLIAGRIDYICNYVSIGAAAVKQGQVKAIAMLARERTPAPAGAAHRRRAGIEGFRRVGLERDPAAEKRDAGDGGEIQRRGEQGARQPGSCVSGSTPSGSLRPHGSKEPGVSAQSSSTPKSRNGRSP